MEIGKEEVRHVEGKKVEKKRIPHTSNVCKKITVILSTEDGTLYVTETSMFIIENNWCFYISSFCIVFDFPYNLENERTYRIKDKYQWLFPFNI